MHSKESVRKASSQIPGAVVVTYNPGNSFLTCIDAIIRQVDCVVIVDNGSAADRKRFLQESIQNEKVELISNEINCGVAKALNQGIRRIVEKGYSWVLTMDQDGKPQPGMVEEILRVYQKHPKKDCIAILVPNIDDPSIQLQGRYLRPRWKIFFERSLCKGEWLDGVSIAISSGALIRTEIFEELGDFREDFFIDYVDTEYCLRALSKGYRIVVACHAKQEHRLGNRRRIQLGPIALYPTFHSPERWYYLGRNRIPMIRTYGRHFPHWLLYDLIAGLYGVSRMLLLEDEKLIKLISFLRGIAHGLQGKMGKVS